MTNARHLWITCENVQSQSFPEEQLEDRSEEHRIRFVISSPSRVRRVPIMMQAKFERKEGGQPQDSH